MKKTQGVNLIKLIMVQFTSTAFVCARKKYPCRSFIELTTRKQCIQLNIITKHGVSLVTIAA